MNLWIEAIFQAWLGLKVWMKIENEGWDEGKGSADCLVNFQT